MVVYFAVYDKTTDKATDRVTKGVESFNAELLLSGTPLMRNAECGMCCWLIVFFVVIVKI